jgi:hypothetical protein
MTECISQLSLEFHPTLPVTVAFDAPQISSDGCVVLLRQMDDRPRLRAYPNNYSGLHLHASKTTRRSA